MKERTMEMTRRVFMKAGAAALVGLGTVPKFLVRAAFAAPGTGGNKILVAIFQRGAADGLNMVVPHGDRQYYALRSALAIAPPARDNAEGAVDLNGFFGLHPALAPFKPLYDDRRLAAIHAVGSPDNTRSHFDAQDYMESGTPGRKSTPDGWLNRYLKAKAQQQASPFRAVALARRLPRSLMGDAPAVAMGGIHEFDVRGGMGGFSPRAGLETLYERGVRDLLHGTGRETFAAVKMLKAADPARYQPENGADYPRGPFGLALQQIAQLIKADIGLEIAFADSNGWDTHVAQGAAQGQMAVRLAEFSQAIAAFHQDLGDRMRNVVILTMSEFGRTVRENGNRGTDHGHANAMFVLGGPVKGGKVYGQWPGLRPEQLHEGRDLALTTDFRDVFAEVIARHMGLRDPAPVFPGYQPSPSRFRHFLV
jgi:uncharacterized protein (DUF1501 family)